MMVFKKYIFIISSIFILDGCSLPNWISDPLSQYKTNLTTYFNIYYNANRLFEEGEKEIRKQEIDLIKKNLQSHIFNIPLLPTTPATSQQKLTDAIAKSSKILSLHSNSSYVDDAIFLIGKSYYLMNEHFKAERKFQELLATSNDEELKNEAKLFLVKTYRKQLLFEKELSLLNELQNTDDDEIKSEVYFEFGYLYQQQKNKDEAFKYFEKAIELTENDLLIPYLSYSLGNLATQLNKKDEANNYFTKLKDLEDIDYHFLAEFELINLSSAENKIDKYKSMLEDPLYKSYRDKIEYEIAMSYYLDKKYETALSYFNKIDTTYKNSEVSGKSYFTQAEYYEIVKGDLIKALDKYKSAIANKLTPDLKIIADEKYSSLNIYLKTKNEIAKIEILIDTLNSQYQNIKSDSLKNISISAKDSLVNLLSAQQYELATYFYINKNNVDSASYYLNKIVNSKNKTEIVASSIYMLAEITNINKSLKDSLYNILITDYPKSKYSSKINKDKKIKSEVAFSSLEEAEKYLTSQNYLKAQEVYSRIIKTTSSPQEKEKAMLALGFIYEKYLQRNDSAKSIYSKIVDQFPKSTSTERIKGRIKKPEIVKTDSLIIKTDSLIVK
ncbi:MAG: tetratricopeptide repeat protein [Ignavibacteria bacterium]|nr:tetratricopeptide repeat protein [Ignavibacteria bacterium]